MGKLPSSKNQINRKLAQKCTLKKTQNRLFETRIIEIDFELTVNHENGAMCTEEADRISPAENVCFFSLSVLKGKTLRF